MEKQKDIDTFRDGIFALQTRRFGNVAEIMISLLFNLRESRTLAFDRMTKDTNERVEIKFSKVLKKNKDIIRKENVIEQCNKAATLANRALRSDEVDRYLFDCNIQQIKPDIFDILYYGLFFLDCIEIYKMKSSQISKCKEYSKSQHRGNKGEGQFHMNNTTIIDHRKNFFVNKITYEDLYNLFKQHQMDLS